MSVGVFLVGRAVCTTKLVGTQHEREYAISIFNIDLKAEKLHKIYIFTDKNAILLYVKGFKILSQIRLRIILIEKPGAVDFGVILANTNLLITWV